MLQLEGTPLRDTMDREWRRHPRRAAGIASTAIYTHLSMPTRASPLMTKL
jgi:hypothetical protein